ncbi:hypothetical protein [Phocaeicola coprocola]|uniref:hypothetical protein n=1 Tax=Phocaeicola coprocola TaxID=310298 RepID=UPI001C392802|nr:hypothetical protein [Phocaeicola coprocola]MBV3867591.1 hypothetical protein [Phocaeicola coprocola]MBV4008749.1 hypothetical protein [Phocaeicola coprocola]MBV4033258.1 hypothetical protein [Phocaeicola coprocola]MBV4039793.1 hypothetical protein [Phocaeicola coprocola]MBV4061451.1 hypothetical protein [Phocaeicola coprocola]
MTLLICNSNLFVPVILTKILSNQEETFLVLVDQDCFKNLFEFLCLQNVILIITRNPSIKQIYSTKKALLKQLNKYKITDIIFYHNEFGDISNWVIHKLSSKAQIYHGNIYDSLPYPIIYNFKGLKLKLKHQVLYHTNIDPKYNGNRFIPSLSKKFFQNNHVHNIQCISNLTIINKYLNHKLNIDQNKILLLTGSVVASHQIDEQTYTQYMNNIISTIGENRILSKCHPRFNDLFGQECKIQQIPSFIPANLILNNFEYFIGYNSTLLVEAAIAGKKAISLIDLIPAINPQTPQSWHTFFTNRLQKDYTIYFPKTIEELLSYIHL